MEREKVPAVRLRAARLAGRATASTGGGLEANPWRAKGGPLSRAFIAGYRAVLPVADVMLDDDSGEGGRSV